MRTLIGLMVATASMLVLGSTPAYAGVDDSDYSTPWKCVNYYNITTCAYAGWSKQADGTGVRLEWMEVWTSNGCGSLESEGGKYDPSNWYFQNPRTGANDYVYNFGAEPCNWEKNVSNAGSDTRAMYIKMSIKARVDWRGDKWVRIGWRLSPNGTYEVLYANTQDA